MDGDETSEVCAADHEGECVAVKKRGRAEREREDRGGEMGKDDGDGNGIRIMIMTSKRDDIASVDASFFAYEVVFGEKNPAATVCDGR